MVHDDTERVAMDADQLKGGADGHSRTRCKAKSPDEVQTDGVAAGDLLGNTVVSMMAHKYDAANDRCELT
jgi:hypothetical protein